GSPVQPSSVPSTAKLMFSDCRILTKARVTRLLRSSKEPAQPIQNRISGLFPWAASSAIVGIFCSSCSTSVSQLVLSCFIRPVKAVGRRKFPGGKIVFNILEHGVPGWWRPRFLHGYVAPDVQDDFKRTDHHRACLDARLACRAGVDLFARDVVTEQRLPVVKTGTAFGQAFRHILHTVARVHHNLPRRKRFARDICRALVAASAALVTGIRTQKADPGKVVDIPGAEACRRAGR